MGDEQELTWDEVNHPAGRHRLNQGYVKRHDALENFLELCWTGVLHYNLDNGEVSDWWGDFTVELERLRGTDLRDGLIAQCANEGV